MNVTKHTTEKKAAELEKWNGFTLSNYPSAGPRPNITGMKAKYWGKDAYCVKCGQYVYNVPKHIYDLF